MAENPEFVMNSSRNRRKSSVISIESDDEK
jgi:hypothetical protein